jgi:hypothetical protein
MMPPGDDLVMLLGQRLTPARLAAFGAAAFIPALRAWRNTLPEDVNRAALSELRWHSALLAAAFRQWIDNPNTEAGYEGERRAARLCSEWQGIAARVHPAFRPLFPLPADRAERGLDALGFPLSNRAAWPQPRKEMLSDDCSP